MSKPRVALTRCAAASTDAEITARMTRDFEADLARSGEIDLHEWRKRPLWEKLVGTVAWILERQQ